MQISLGTSMGTPAGTPAGTPVRSGRRAALHAAGAADGGGRARRRWPGRSARTLVHLPLLQADDAWWILPAGLVYRVCGGLVSALGLILNGRTTADGAVAATAILMSAAVGLAVWPARAALHSRPQLLRGWMAVDTLLLFALNLWASHQVSGSLGEPFKVVFWSQMQGLVAMWWAVAGPWAVAALVAGSSVLVLAMIEVNGRVESADLASVVLTQVMWLALAVLTVYVLKALLAARGTEALGEGVEAGQELQRLRHLREVHDTVLQTLEGIALYASADSLDERQRLQSIAQSAHSEALRLREDLRRADARSRTDAGAEDLRCRLETCLEEFRARGMRVRLVTRDDDDVSAPVPAHVAGALRDAMSEALTNVAKHARADQVQVFLGRRAGGVQLVVEDDGRGFDPRYTAHGFGIPHSIERRLAECGGWSRVWSAPGLGTRVTLGIDDVAALPVTEAARWQTPSLGLAVGRR